MSGQYTLARGNESTQDLYVAGSKTSGSHPDDPNLPWPPGVKPGVYGDYSSSNPSLAGPSSPALSDENIPLNSRSAGFKSEKSPFNVHTVNHAGKKKSRRNKIIAIAVAAIILIALAIALPVYFFVIKPKSRNGSTAGAAAGVGEEDEGTAPEPSPTSEVRLTRGGDGSEITMEDGRTFTYRNRFGGTWVHDPEDPFNLDAQANDFSPPLNTTWTWGVYRVFGVNLGGWFVLEPFITPGIFQRYPGAIDEYTLTELMRAEGESGGPGLAALEEHYETFITEQDIAAIAGAGLNWLRVPLGFWAVETYEGEPFLERTSWTYFLKVVEWARKYGLRIYLDLHALPGSQNAMNHSARIRRLGFLSGNMGLANAQRTLYTLRVLTEFISQPEYRSVIPMIGLVNEPDSRPGAIGQEPLSSFYLEAYNMIREIGGFGEGNGPYIVVGDGFRGIGDWEGIMPNADRFVVDMHPYIAFDDNMEPDLLTDVAEDGELGGVWPRTACDRWGAYFNSTRRDFGITLGGEFSAAINDCGLFLREVGIESFHPLCPVYDAWEDWTPEMKEGLLNFVLASFDAIGDFFWWTWKIGDSIDGRITAPFWSYELGLREGWIPRDPRSSIGKCAALGTVMDPFDGNYQPWQTGAAVPAPTIPADYIAANPWPPAILPDIDVDMALLPTYTATGPVITMPVPTYSGAPASATRGLDGWFNDLDTAPAPTPIPGCPYPDLYDGVFAVIPTEACTGA